MPNAKHHNTSKPTAGNPRLRALQARFAAFRSAHPPRTKIPGELRRAALEAINEGIRPTQVYRACRLSSSQLADWRRALPTAPTVLTLTDDDPQPPQPATHPASISPSTELDFQFQLAGWVVRVHLDRASPSVD